MSEGFKLDLESVGDSKDSTDSIPVYQSDPQRKLLELEPVRRKPEPTTLPTWFLGLIAVAVIALVALLISSELGGVLGGSSEPESPDGPDVSFTDPSVIETAVGKYLRKRPSVEGSLWLEISKRSHPDYRGDDKIKDIQDLLDFRVANDEAIGRLSAESMIPVIESMNGIDFSKDPKASEVTRAIGEAMQSFRN